MPTRNKTKELAALQMLSEGLAKHTNDIPSLVLGAQTLPNAEMVARVEQDIALAKATEAARVAYLEAVATERASREAHAPFLKDLKQTLRARFSSSPTQLADFGLAVFTRSTPSPETHVVAAAKARATRAARGTKGSKQRAAIHGDVSGVVVTPQRRATPSPGSSSNE